MIQKIVSDWQLKNNTLAGKELILRTQTLTFGPLSLEN